VAELAAALLAPCVAFVDLETTGGNPLTDRITEVAIIRVTEGLIDFEWSSLINPERPIPPLISRVTGISDDMVAHAPTFAELADEIRDRLSGALFVAHNARFDYGFLKNEFRRLEQPFFTQMLCSVKFSRALYPQHHRHGLDALIERHGLACSARHRALGDARAVWDFVQIALREHGPEKTAAALTRALKAPSLPSGLDPDVLDQIPDGPGVYLFFGEGSSTPGNTQLPLYIGKSVTLRARVLSHFSADHRDSKDARIAQQVQRIEWQETAGELGALLLEARLVKEHLPIHNRQLRRQGELCAWHFSENAPAPVLQLVQGADIDPAQLGALFGTYRSKRDAVKSLRELAVAHQLCPKRLGLESGAGPCFSSQIKRCRGVCRGAESALSHDARLLAALSSLRLKAWPFGGRIAVAEYDAFRDRHDFHLCENWCHLGTVQDEAALHEAVHTRSALVFDVDTYKILTRFLASDHGARIIALPARG
jgi:DNA polymerase-3 subunit epsilon